MSAAFVASPASSEGIHDGFQSRMRLDTQAQRQQQDAQSFLSAESPFEEIGLSPASFVLVSPEESTHAHNSDIGAEDWQLMSSNSPSNQYGAPQTSGGETRQAQQQYPGSAHYIPRNLSVTSSMSSVAANTGHYHSPMSSSPIQPFRRQSPYFPSAQAQPQQSFAESFNQWSTAAPMQNITAPASTTVFFPNVNTAVPVVPSNYSLGSNATITHSQEPWSALSHRHPGSSVAYNTDFDHTGLLTFSSASGSTIVPPAQQEQSFPGPAWPFHETNTWFDFDPSRSQSMPRQLSIDPSASGSDNPDPRNRLYRDDTDSSRQYSHQHSPMPSSKVKVEEDTPPLPPNEGSRNVEFQFVPEPRPQHSHGPRAIRHQQKRVGGRPVGSKFEREKADKIKQRREDGACWTCSLQRDECSGGDTCRRCERRMQRPNADVVLMCDRTKLTELKEVFIPPILTNLYERKQVESFARIHIAHWYKKAIPVPCKLIWGFEPIIVTMYEFTPKDEVIRNSLLGIENHRAQETQIEARKSPPLGLMMLDLPEVHLFSREFDDIVDNWLDIFVRRFYAKDEDDFAPRLLALMADLGSKDESEHKFLRDVFRLLVVTYVLSHAVTIAESQRHECLSHLQSAHPSMFPKHCGSKLANRQLKHLFSSIRDTLTDRILRQLSQFLKSSKRYSRWTSAFCAIIGLAMAEEQGMQLVHLIYATEARDGMFSAHVAEREGVKACGGIEDRFIFVTKLFRIKYHAKFNPLRDHERENVREHLSAQQLEFVRSVAALCAEKGEYLRDRAHVRIAPENSIKYTARLVSQFILSFWPPA